MDADNGSRGKVTELLHELSGGNHAAVDDLIPPLYQELRQIAAAQLRQERPGHTLEVTALVHEAYLRMVDQRQVNWQDRAHFLAVAARVMRRILLDYAKRRTRQKRGGNARRTALDEAVIVSQDRAAELVEIDEALERLEVLDQRQARVVEMRFYGGLSVEETAAALGVSEPTVKREWAMARAWLRREVLAG